MLQFQQLSNDLKINTVTFSRASAICEFNKGSSENTLSRLASNDLFDGVWVNERVRVRTVPKRRAEARFFILAFSTLQSSHEP